MKRKALCAFSLLMYLLLLCTILAPMVQREMAVLAEVRHLPANKNYNPQIPASAVLWGEQESLFHVVQGTGWSEGNRVEILPGQYYSLTRDFYGNIGHVTIHPGTEYTAILSASKVPQEGNLVEIAEMEPKDNEKFILYCPEGMEGIGFTEAGFTVIRQGEQGMLLKASRIKMPFFEHQILYSLGERITVEGMRLNSYSGAGSVMTQLTAEGLRLYSYSEARSFLLQLPLLALMTGLLLGGILLWGGTCMLTKSRKLGRLLWWNIGAAAGTLLLVWFVTLIVDLPASLMPGDSILELSHYFREFSNIFAVLGSAGSWSLQILWVCMTVVSAALILGVPAIGIRLLRLEAGRTDPEEE